MIGHGDVRSAGVAGRIVATCTGLRGIVGLEQRLRRFARRLASVADFEVGFRPQIHTVPRAHDVQIILAIVGGRTCAAATWLRAGAARPTPGARVRIIAHGAAATCTDNDQDQAPHPPSANAPSFHDRETATAVPRSKRAFSPTSTQRRFDPWRKLGHSAARTPVRVKRSRAAVVPSRERLRWPQSPIAAQDRARRSGARHRIVHFDARALELAE